MSCSHPLKFSPSAMARVCGRRNCVTASDLQKEELLTLMWRALLPYLTNFLSDEAFSPRAMQRMLLWASDAHGGKAPSLRARRALGASSVHAWLRCFRCFAVLQKRQQPERLSMSISNFAAMCAADQAQGARGAVAELTQKPCHGNTGILCDPRCSVASGAVALGGAGTNHDRSSSALKSRLTHPRRMGNCGVLLLWRASSARLPHADTTAGLRHVVDISATFQRHVVLRRSHGQPPRRKALGDPNALSWGLAVHA